MARLNEGLERAATKKPVQYTDTPVDESEEPLSEPSPSATEASEPAGPQRSTTRPRRQPQNATAQSQREQPTAIRRVRMESVITELKRAGKDTLTYCDTIPLKTEPELHPPRCNLALLKLSAVNLPFLDDLTLYGWLTSNDILPCIRQWKQECLENEQLRSSLFAALPVDDFPSKETTEYLSRMAPRYATIVNQQAGLQHPHAEAFLPCLKYIRRLKRCSMAHFMHFLVDSQYPNLDEFIYTFCTRALLSAYVDLRTNGPTGFFGVMLNSRYAEPMILLARRAWDKLLILPGSSSAVDTSNSVGTIQAASIAFAAGRTQEAINTSASPENNQDLHWEAAQLVSQLQNDFVTAVGENPDIMTIVPAEIGQTQLRKDRKGEQKAGFPKPPVPQPPEVINRNDKRKPECDDACQKPYLHTRDCSARVAAAQEEWRKNKGSVDAVVPDMGTPLSTYNMSTLVPPEQVMSRFNHKEIIDPFSDEEKLLAFKMFRLYLNLHNGEAMDVSFEWTLISEVLAGRGVADCVKFYYQHKHIIDMRLKGAPTELTFRGGEPKWGPHLDEDLKEKLRKHFDVDRFLEFIAEMEADNTDMKIKIDQNIAAARQYEQGMKFEKARAVEHKAKREEYEAKAEEQRKEIEALKAENKEQKKAIESLKAGDEERKKEINTLKAGEEERKKEIDVLKAEIEKLKEQAPKKEFNRPPVTYGNMPPGWKFLEGTTFTPQPKQWRGEK